MPPKSLSVKESVAASAPSLAPAVTTLLKLAGFTNDLRYVDTACQAPVMELEGLWAQVES